MNKFVLVLTGICPHHTELYNWTLKCYSKSLALIAGHAEMLSTWQPGCQDIVSDGFGLVSIII